MFSEKHEAQLASPHCPGKGSQHMAVPQTLPAPGQAERSRAGAQTRKSLPSALSVISNSQDWQVGQAPGRAWAMPDSKGKPRHSPVLVLGTGEGGVAVPAWLIWRCQPQELCPAVLLALSWAQPRASHAGQEALVLCSSSQAQRPLPLQILVATRARSQCVPLAHGL